jgi:hypothetical protein
LVANRTEHVLRVVRGDTSWGTLYCQNDSGEEFDLDSFLLDHPGSRVESIDSPNGNMIKVVTGHKRKR